MRRTTGLRCLCGAAIDETDTDTINGPGIALTCLECGTAETWPEHLTIEPTQARSESAA